MQRTAGTSLLHQARVDLVTPARLAAFDAAVERRDFVALGDLIMAESNTLQVRAAAVCVAYPQRVIRKGVDGVGAVQHAPVKKCRI
jgi:mevalonate pyrophosphate decarboxylase